MKKSDRNLAVIQNFILHLTHSGEHGLDAHYKEEMVFTPEIMYRVANEYIAEDHVDGEDNPEDEIPTYGTESSYVLEDLDRNEPESVVVVANYGDEIGTKTVATIKGIDNLKGVQDLIDEIQDPKY